MLTFRTPEEAVEKANNTPYGLSAGVWTEKGSRILWMAQRLKTGVVWANTYNRFDPTSPFGGYKESGFGREGGHHGLGRTSSSTARRSVAERLPVKKTYKLFISGAFPRSESGAPTRPRDRTSPGRRGRTCATQSGRRAPDHEEWAALTAYNRAGRSSTASPR